MSIIVNGGVNTLEITIPPLNSAIDRLADKHENHPGSLFLPQLYLYPIKSLRGAAVSSAEITKQGFQYDRRFMLLKVNPNGFANMHIVHHYEMALFHQEIEKPNPMKGVKGKIKVTYCPPGKSSKTLEVPLQPDTTNLESIQVTMHRSSTQAYNMGTEFNRWFSDCLGYDVVLAYIGDNTREVLGNLAPGANGQSSSWISSITSSLPVLGSDTEKASIGFSDCAPFLVVTETSLDDVSARLSAGEKMDITKFRPNIVVGSSELGAYEEDFWGELTINNETKIDLTANCGRCMSINVDYRTGKAGEGEMGNVLKKLMKDRRVDAGAKYSPGRYYLEGIL
ncbi:MAG: hypothetical protein M1834_008364 [Cirrosporium novae-zelandiae]|nr:MAG: hypothetical protein M1834_008364 [Cirrosporium novae-zelandiae]